MSAARTGIEDDRDRRPGAGAAPGHEDGTPRAQAQRGRNKNRNAGFYAQLAQIRPVSEGSFGRDKMERPIGTRAATLGDWIGSSRWTTTASDRRERFENSPRDDNGGSTQASEEASIELGQFLSGIAEDVNQRCATVCAGISAEFAARMEFARKTLPRDQVAGVVAMLRAACKAALVVARKNAKEELTARKKAAKEQFGGPRKPPHRPRPRSDERSGWGR